MILIFQFMIKSAEKGMPFPRSGTIQAYAVAGTEPKVAVTIFNDIMHLIID